MGLEPHIKMGDQTLPSRYWLQSFTYYKEQTCTRPGRFKAKRNIMRSKISDLFTLESEKSDVIVI